MKPLHEVHIDWLTWVFYAAIEHSNTQLIAKEKKNS